MEARSLLALGVVLLLLGQASLTVVAAPPAVPLDGPPVERWTQTYGGPKNERAFAATPIADGHVLGGSTTSFGHLSDRQSDMWVVHVDAEGQRTWSRTLGTTGSETVRDLVVSEDGSVLVLGELGVGQGSRLYRLDASGNVEWSRLSGPDRIARAAIGIDGGKEGYLVVGNVLSEGFPRPGAYAFVASNGSVGRIEQLTGRSVAVETFTTVIETSDGDFLLLGESDRGEGDVDGWTVRLSPDGTVVWNRLIPQPNAELHPTAVTELPDGDFVAVGFERRGRVDDGWVARLNGDTGAVEWRQRYDRLSFTDVTSNGRGTLVVGSTFESRVTRDALVLALDGQGRELWRQTYGGSENDVFTVLAPTETGYLLVGWTDSGREKREEFFAVAVDPAVTVASVSVSTDRVAPGESVTVTATLSNRADEMRSFRAPLVVDGAVSADRSLTVPPGNDTQVRYTVTFDTVGRHTVSVADADPVTVVVSDQPTATPEPSPEPTPVPTPASSPTPVEPTDTTQTTSPGVGVVVTVVAVFVVAGTLVAIAARASRRVRQRRR